MAELKISDLSVGDWVLNRKGFPTKVQVITSEGNMRCGEDAKPEHSVHIWITDVSPIPITPEILEKNGFEKERSSYKWTNSKHRVFIWLKKFSYFIDIIEMEKQFATKNSCIEVAQLHIHQLQHALRLAGVEKEIELW